MADQSRYTFVLLFFIASVLITFVIVSIMWLSFSPQIPEFRVDTLTLYNFNISSNSLISGNWDACFTVRNPSSKLTLYYDQIEVVVFYKSDSISETTVPPFVQGTKNETAVRATFALLTAYVDGINGDRNHGTVNFDVEMTAKVRFNGGDRRRRIFKVHCPNLSIGVSATGGSLVGGSNSKDCWVDIPIFY